MRLAEQRTLDLVIPAFALSEPFATVTHRGRARRVELDTLMYERAMRNQARFGLSPQDAIMYAAVIDELSRLSRDTSHSFISKNWKGFGDPGIRAELSTYGCQFIESFTEGARLLGAE